MKVSTIPFFRVILLLAFLQLSSHFKLMAQDGYTLVGTARSGSVLNSVSLTEERPGQPQTGALWYNKPVRLSRSFEVEFTVNFGANPFGADGVTIVLQTMGTSVLGGSGSGIGYRGLRPSIGIEFDTHFNSDVADPRGDHMALVRDGNNSHQFNSFFPDPVPISTTSNSVKDGRDRLVKIRWNAANRILQVDVDCVTKIKQSIDLINDVFLGKQEVYFGLTASTGIVGNSNTVVVPKDIIDQNTFQACPMDSLTLVAGPSLDGKYEWKPATGLSNPAIQNPRLVATTDQVYTVSYVNRCSQLKVDSIFVKTNTPGLSIGGNREVCENEKIELNPILKPTSANARFRWSTGDTTRQYTPKTSGLYKLQVSIENCTVSDSAVVTFHPLPKLGPLIDSTFDCLTDSPIKLDPKATGQNLKYLWTPTNSTESTLYATQSGRYSVEVSNEFGCSTKQNFTILNNCLPATMVFIPDVFTPNGDGSNEVFEWKSNVEVEAQMKIFNRWGEVIFSSSNPREFWDGTCNGQLCPANIYSWKLDYRSSQSKTTDWLEKRGEVFLVR